MARSSAVAVTSSVEEDTFGLDQIDASRNAPVLGLSATDLGSRDASPKTREKKVPHKGRLWGFVRTLKIGEKLTLQASKKVQLADDDVTLWWDVEHYRFLVAAKRLVIDDLSPLEFVQFVRELCDVTNRVLFKYERHHDGSPGRVYRVWW